MAGRDIIVVGASAGGIESLTGLLNGLPADFPAAVFVVWHMPTTSVGVLPRMLERYSVLPIDNAVDGEPVVPGRVYTAPPDHHLLLENGHVRLTRGPKENRFRPAVDPLFRSAAYSYGSRVVGVVLSGALDDGTSGLWMIKDRGGIAVVQDPVDAIVPDMPRNALRNVDVDYTVRLSEMPGLLAQLVAEPLTEAGEPAAKGEEPAEMQIPKRVEGAEWDMDKLGEVTQFTCPECHGSLWRIHEGRILRFRCRTGHAYTADSLLTGLGESIEDTLWAAVRSLEESASLLRHIHGHLLEQGDEVTASAFLAEAERAERRGQQVRAALGEEDRHSG